LDGAIFYDEENEPAGQVLILRDITREKRVERSNQALFRIAKALHHYRRLDDLLEFITREVQSRIAVEAASVILLDEEKNEFFFREGTYDDTEAGKKFKEIRFPADKGVAGQVYKSGQPLIVPDTSQCPFFFQKVDQKAGYRTRNILDVPIWIQERMIGVLCAVNKKDGPFDTTDVELLSAIASIAALPLENARINEKLKRSYEEVKSMSRAKDRVIHHLSHELKTPLSVLAASLGLLTKKLTGLEDRGWKRIMDRAERNLQRILEMQYEIEDILRERDYKSYYMLSILLEACADELEVLVSGEVGQDDVLPKIRGRIEELFGPRESISQEVDLTRGVEQIVASIRPRFAHRKCRLKTRFDPTVSAFIPPDVLTKIVEGLIRNAVENTPDGGRIDVSVRNGRKGPEFEVKDNGVGITEENQRLILEGNLTSYETLQYSSRKPYDFNAGGKGFDLLRMKIFSERYHFNIRMNSRRCPFIPQNVDICPGRIDDCDHSRETTDCSQSGGTTMIIQFSPPDRMSSRNKDKG
jgi:signal transduction histidine kinase